MENNEKIDFKKTGKILTICMIAAAVLCPIICDWNGVASFFSGGGTVSLPSYTTWSKYDNNYGSTGSRSYHFATYGGHNSGTLTVCLRGCHDSPWQT